MKWKVRAAKLWSIVTLESADQPLSASLTSCTAVTPHWIQRLSSSGPVAARFRPMQASCTNCWSLKRSRRTRSAVCPPWVRHAPRPVGFSPSPPVSVVLWTPASPPPTPRHSPHPQLWPVQWWRSLDKTSWRTGNDDTIPVEMRQTQKWRHCVELRRSFVVGDKTFIWVQVIECLYKAHSGSLSGLQSLWQNSCDKGECEDMQTFRRITFNILLN